MSNENWSGWFSWPGSNVPPVNEDTIVDIEYRCGKVAKEVRAGSYRWTNKGCDVDIIAYRYRIEENEMDSELEFVARKCADWPSGFKWACVERLGPRSEPHLYWSNAVEDDHHVTQIDRAQWLQARKDLGLIMTESEEELPAEEWGGRVSPEDFGAIADPEDDAGHKYNAYFKDVRHIATLDVYRVVSLFDCEKHGHPISHAAKKLLLSGSRTGGKDVEADVREAIDALYRWLEMREEDRKS